jgi:hypothetical protein
LYFVLFTNCFLLLKTIVSIWLSTIKTSQTLLKKGLAGKQIVAFKINISIKRKLGECNGFIWEIKFLVKCGVRSDKNAKW